MAVASIPADTATARRGEALGAGIAAFAVLLLLRGSVLLDPPYWDGVLGVFPQVDWQARHGLDPFRLLREQPGYVEGGACVYPFSAIPPLAALLQRAVADEPTRFALLHLASFAWTALAASALFRLVRPLGRAAAWTVAAAFLAQPTVQAQASQIGLEMPLVATLAASLAALAERRHGAAAAWAAAALLVKPTGVVAAAVGVAVLLVREVAPRVAGARAPRDRAWLAVFAALLATLVAQLVLVHAAGRAPAGAGPFAGLATLVTKRLPSVPEFALALAAVGALGIAAWRRRKRGRALEARVLALATFLAAYMGLLAQWDNALPRYFVAAWPAVLALVATLVARVAPRAVVPAFAACALFGLLGARGAFQPERAALFAGPDGAPLAPSDGWLLERSMRFRDGLELDRRIARAAAEIQGVAWIAPWPVHQELSAPSLGYADLALPCASPGNSVRWTEAARPAAADLLASGRDVLWVVTPNDFSGPGGGFRPGDVVVRELAVGAQRAFLVRRARFP